MSAGGFAAPYTPRQRRMEQISDADVTTLPSAAELALRVAEQVRVKALLDAQGAADLLAMLGLAD